MSGVQVGEGEMWQHNLSPQCHRPSEPEPEQGLAPPILSSGWPCGPHLLTQQMGHHVGKSGSWGTRTPGTRQMASGGGAGWAQRGLSNGVGVGALDGPQPPQAETLPSASLVLTPHQEVLEVPPQAPQGPNSLWFPHGSAWARTILTLPALRLWPPTFLPVRSVLLKCLLSGWRH